MSKLIFSTDNFQCHLLCDQCTHLTNSGIRCRRRVCLGYPTCWQHTIQQYGIQVKESSIQGAGKGLFVTRDFKKGEWICPYVGEVIDQNCTYQRYTPGQTCPYMIEKDGTEYIDAACVRGIGSMANCLVKNNGDVRSVEAHNASFSWRTSLNEPWLKTTKNIKKGREIFVYYGSDFKVQDNHITKRGNGPDTRPC